MSTKLTKANAPIAHKALERVHALTDQLGRLKTQVRQTEGFIEQAKDVDHKAVVVELAKIHMEQNKAYYELVHTDWTLCPILAGVMPVLRTDTRDYGYSSGGSRGELGDGDPTPTRWISQMKTALVWRTEPTTAVKQAILDIYGSEAGARMHAVEQLWSRSKPFAP